MKELYEPALELYKRHNWKEARDAFTELRDYNDSQKYIAKCDNYLKFYLNNIVEYGFYEGKPIKWKVAEVKGNLRLLFASDIVTEHAYNDVYLDTYWHSATIRKWLNSEFINEAFTPEERFRIMSTRVVNPPSEKFKSEGGRTVMDKIFIPSMYEVQQYLSDNERKINHWWWTRTPGMGLLCTTAVYLDGSLYEQGININYPEGGVRPAMWILLK